MRTGGWGRIYFLGKNARVHHMCPASFLAIDAMANHAIDKLVGCGEDIADLGTEASTDQGG